MISDILNFIIIIYRYYNEWSIICPFLEGKNNFCLATGKEQWKSCLARRQPIVVSNKQTPAGDKITQPGNRLRGARAGPACPNLCRKHGLKWAPTCPLFTVHVLGQICFQCHISQGQSQTRNEKNEYKVRLPRVQHTIWPHYIYRTIVF